MKSNLRLGLFAGSLILVCLSTGAVSFAADVSPAAILSNKSVAYVRFDGLKAHEEELGKTALGDIFAQHLRPLVQHIQQLTLDALGPEVLSENLLSGAAPEQLLEIQRVAAGMPSALEHLYNHGVILGVEADAQPQLPPKFQVTVVIPNTNEQVSEALLGIIQLLAMSGDMELGQQQIDGRTVISFEEDGVKMSGWKEGDHVVWTIGSLDVERTIARAAGKQEGLDDSPEFQAFGKFDRYPTYMRGYVDVGRITEVVQEFFPPAQQIVQQFGIDGLKRVAFHTGYEGKYQRSTVLLNMPGDREGVLKLVESLVPISADQLPPIPPDATYIASSGLDAEPVYDLALSLVQLASQFGGGGAAAGDVTESLEAFEQQVGIHLREDIFGEISSPLVFYSAPSEGAFSLGSVMLLKVKDEQKLLASIETLLNSLGALTGNDISIKKSEYRDAVIHTVRAGRNVPVKPSYTIHKGWLAVALYPQPIQGYVLRSGGDYRTWKPSPLVAEVLKAEGAYRSDREKKIVGISQSDPRPTVSELLAVVPLLGMMATSFGGGEDETFDFSLIPNAQAINEHVTPGVAITVDDGEDLRVESYSALPLGFQLTGMQSYYLMLLPYFAYSLF